MSHPVQLLAFLDIGGPEVMTIVFIVLLLFGGKQLPELARGIGKSVREFKRAASGVEEELKKAMEEDPTTDSGTQKTPWPVFPPIESGQPPENPVSAPIEAALPPAELPPPPTEEDPGSHRIGGAQNL